MNLRHRILRGFSAADHAPGQCISKSPYLFFFLAIALNLNCSLTRHTVSNNQTPKSLAFSIELTDINQKTAGDSLGAELARRLLCYAAERKDFNLVKPGEHSDYTFKIRINSFRIVSRDTQITINRSRNSITRKYDNLNDSIALQHRPMSGAELTATNIVANVALNAALLPLGFVGMMVITDEPKRFSPSFKEQKTIDSLSQSAKLDYQAVLVDSTAKTIWKKSGIEYYDLDYLVSEKEQLSVLVRNVVLNFEGKMPFLVIK